MEGETLSSKNGNKNIALRSVSKRMSNACLESKGKHGKQLWLWFLGLTPEERGRVLSFEDKDGNLLVRQMFETQEKKGDGLFFAVDDPVLIKVQEKGRKIKFDSNFCFRSLNTLLNTCFYPERLLQSDKKLEESIRLCDTREYLDTMTVASNLLEDGKEFLELMEVVTRGNFLTHPCKVSWDANTKTWAWESPRWFDAMGYYSLGTYAAHKLEKVLWMRYWDSHRLDPRTKPGPLTYVFPNYLEGLLSKTYLINYWKERTAQERRKIVGSLGNIIQHVLLETDDKDRKKKLRQGDYPKLLSTLVDLSLEEKSKCLELLFTDSDLAQNEKTFIEILYFSPMHRAGIPVDMILRRIGMSIHSAYTEKLSMDLIVGEEAEKIKKADQTESKKKKRKKKKMKSKEKKKDHLEKEQKEKEFKEKIERDRKEKERLLQEQKRQQLETRKTIRSLVMDIVTQAELIIEGRVCIVTPILPELPAIPPPTTIHFLSPQPKKKMKTKKKKKKQDKGLMQSDISFDIRTTPASCPTSPTAPRRANKEQDVQGDRKSRNFPIIRGDLGLCLPQGNARVGLTMRLHREIEDYVTCLRSLLDKWYKPQAEALIKRIRLLAEAIWPNAQVQAYGSYATSLSIIASDLDLLIIGATATYAGPPLRHFANALRQYSWVQSIKAIETAKVPVIKLTSKKENISTDITFNEDESSSAPTYCSSGGLLVRHAGVAASEVVKGFTSKMPAVRPLVLVIKQFLYERGLNNAYTGGLSSYCVVLMVVSFLQLYGGSISVEDKPGIQKNLGFLLVEFLDLFGRRFDYQAMGITVTNGGSHFLLKDSCYKFAPAPLVIVDPLNPTNNIGYSAFGMPRIRRAFADAHSIIMSPFHSGYTPANILSRIILLDQDSSNQNRDENGAKIPVRERSSSLSAPKSSSRILGTTVH